MSLLATRHEPLLTTCSCWTTLGQAVRTAQSIGLHVETESQKSSMSPLTRERRRRVWYSIYVLDRLLSLQLGRPPAIHDQDCHVPLPSRAGDCDIDWESGELPAIPYEDSASSGDYFLAVIAFSKIVGHVLRDLYSPRVEYGTHEDLHNTKELDQQLLQWKLGLPRVLRFDLGHAFNQSIAFKRQVIPSFLTPSIPGVEMTEYR